MSRGALLSGLLHGIAILLLLIGLPDFLKRKLEPPPVIPIEIINISDLTQAPDLKVKPKEDGPKEKPVEKPTPPKPMPVAEKTPEPEKEVEPDPTPELEPEVTMDELLDKIPEEKPKEKPKVQEKPKEKKKDKPKKKKLKKDFTKLLNSIEKTESSSEGPTQPEQDESSTADHAANTIGKLSVTELDLIRRQLAACWNVAAGTRDAKDLYVDVKVEMNPDATVRTAVVVETGGSGSAVRAASESALRAVKNPKCSPLKLPLDRYDQWKTITIRFDPKHIL
jgi:outer membrane biosynthesis protein TonB